MNEKSMKNYRTVDFDPDLPDTILPKPERKPLEKDIEKKAVREAAKGGWLSYKFTSPARRSVPDRIFIRKGVVLFVEFKAAGKNPTKRQDQEIEELRAAGAKVAVCRSAEEALSFLKRNSKDVGGL